MAIKFEETGGGKPAEKQVGGKTYVAEEPAPDRSDPNGPSRPGKPDKKGRKTKPK